MLHLPPYADNKIGRALIAEVLAARPDSRPIRDDWGTRDYPRYSGKPAALLRKLHREWLEREDNALKAQYEVSGVWDLEGSVVVYGTENADQLIQRLLAETAEQREAA